MCILFIYANPKCVPGKYRLIIATNRDEYFQRPAEPVHSWKEDTDIIGGRDMEPGREGGTWLAMSVRPGDTFKMRLGVLLNVTGEPKPMSCLGRGFIINDYLKSNKTAKRFVEEVRNEKQVYNAFSFVAAEIGETSNVLYYSNVDDTVLSMGDSEVFEGFGNSPFLTPLSKVKAGKERFKNIIDEFNEIPKRNDLVDQLLALLQWEKRHLPDEELERRAPNMMEFLSAVFVNVPDAGYGTRTHTIILVDWDGKIEYIEHTMQSPENSIWLQQDMVLKI